MKVLQKGGVMLEVLVSVALFGVAIVGLLGMLGISAMLSTESRYRTEAAALANELFGEMAAAAAVGISTLSWEYGESSSKFANWRTARLAMLPGGKAEIEFENGTRVDDTGAPTGSTFVTLTITWKAPNDTSATGGKFVTSTYFY
ncbi:MAG: hypothetical protein LBE32_05720 [Burkholderiales bacterium]|nr:hypothetical protein [Burkholderiales bacterium]